MAKPIICVKLTSGEELIATVNDPRDILLNKALASEVFNDQNRPWPAEGTYVLENILSIAVQPTGSGNMALALIPWLVGDHETPAQLNFDKYAMAVYPPRKEIEKAYLQQTSGIQIASANSHSEPPKKIGRDLGSKIKM